MAYRIQVFSQEEGQGIQEKNLIADLCFPAYVPCPAQGLLKDWLKIGYGMLMHGPKPDVVITTGEEVWGIFNEVGVYAKLIQVDWLSEWEYQAWQVIFGPKAPSWLVQADLAISTILPQG